MKVSISNIIIDKKDADLFKSNNKINSELGNQIYFIKNNNQNKISFSEILDFNKNNYDNLSKEITNISISKCGENKEIQPKYTDKNNIIFHDDITDMTDIYFYGENEFDEVADDEVFDNAGSKKVEQSNDSVTSCTPEKLDSKNEEQPSELTNDKKQENILSNIGRKKEDSRKIFKADPPNLNEEQLILLKEKITNKKEEKKSSSNVEENIDIQKNKQTTSSDIYEAISSRYNLNSSSFSIIKNKITDEKLSKKDVMKIINKHLFKNDKLMKKVTIFERFKNIFGKSDKINYLQREHRTDALIIYNKLNGKD